MSTSNVITAKAKSLAPHSTAREDIVTIEIRPSRTKYQVFRKLLTQHSVYFQKSLSDPPAKIQEGLITLEYVNVHVFNIFLHWLTIPEATFPDLKESFEDPSCNPSSVLLHIKLQAYCFGERFQIPEFSRYMTKAIAEHVGVNESTIFSPELILPTVMWAFNNIPSDNPILQLLVNSFCHSWKERADDRGDLDALGQLPRAFVTRVMRRLSERNRMSEEQKAANYCYHKHSSDDEKKSCQALHMRYDRERDYGYFE